MSEQYPDPRQNDAEELSLEDTQPVKTGAGGPRLSQRGWPTWLVYLLAVLGLIYILNPGAGFFELLPDNLPGIGNLDEGVAAVLVWSGLQEYLASRRRRRPRP